MLNPRFKLLILLLFLAVLFLLKTFAGLGLLLLFLLLMMLAVRIPLRYLAGGLRPLTYIILFTIIIYFFFTKGGVVLLRLGPLTVEQAGVTAGLFMIMRLVGLVLMTMLLTLTTTPLALAHGIEYFMMPLGRIGFPAEEVAMVMTMALRFIPTIAEESQRLLRAQMARGADFESGNIFQRAKSLIPILIPLFVSAFRRADELAIAMEARGYRGGEGRTRFRVLKFTYRDFVALVFVAAFVVVVGIYF